MRIAIISIQSHIPGTSIAVRSEGVVLKVAKAERDVRLDLLRGYAMLAIVVNHLSHLLMDLGFSGPKVPTLNALGFSSAAEIFFLLSGYMMGLVYVRSPNMIRKILQRAWKIYRINFAVFFLVMAIVALTPSALADLTHVEYAHEEPFRAIWNFLLFQQHPTYLDVLIFYVFFMVVAPPIILLMKKQRALFISTSLLLYIIAQVESGLNPAVSTPGGDGEWAFNPFAWQLLFFGGVFAGSMRFYDRFAIWASSPRVAGLLGVLFAVGTTVTILEGRSGLALVSASLTDKQDLGLLRLAHALIVVALLTWGASAMRRYFGTWPFRLLALIGRNTLHCFAVSIVATYALASAWLQFPPSFLMYLILLASILILVCVTAWVVERDKAPRATA